jgi:hypothetical protein
MAAEPPAAGPPPARTPRRRCEACGQPEVEGMPLCPRDDHRWVPVPEEELAGEEDPAKGTEAPGGTHGTGTQVAGRTCHYCGAVPPHPCNTVCLDCGQPIGFPALCLRFGVAAGGDPVHVDLRGPGSELLGRDPERSRHATALAAFLRVSRVHATVGVDDGGRAWIRDEGSGNGTFHNGKELPTGTRTELRHRDTVALGSELSGTVRLRADDTPVGMTSREDDASRDGIGTPAQ